MLTVADLQQWEEQHGAIPQAAIVILHTGRGRHYGNPKKYFGRPEGLSLPGDDTLHLHFPGVSPQAAQWLVDRRNISGERYSQASLSLVRSFRDEIFS